MKRSSPKRTRRTKKPKTTISSVLRAWGLPDYLIKNGKKGLKYRNPLEKGIAWYWFSMFIRKRDIEKYGKCISCGGVLTWENAQAGHYIPAGQCGRDLLFDEMNNHGECRTCNLFNTMHLIGYTKNLDKRYGEGTSDKLLARYAERKRQILKDWNKEKYTELATYYREAVDNTLHSVLA